MGEDGSGRMCVMQRNAPCHAQVVKIYCKPAEEGPKDSL